MSQPFVDRLLRTALFDLEMAGEIQYQVVGRDKTMIGPCGFLIVNALLGKLRILAFRLTYPQRLGRRSAVAAAS